MIKFAIAEQKQCFVADAEKPRRVGKTLKTIIMQQNFIKIFILICFISTISILEAQLWQPTIVNPTTAPPNNGGFGLAGPLPTTLLRVNEGSVLFDGYNGVTPVTGFGRRLMWIPELAAFRAGGVGGPAWDNPGQHSFAGGYDTWADGNFSTAFGAGTRATGLNTFAVGNFSVALGDYSIAMGDQSTASDQFAVAIGLNAIASGHTSTTIGAFTTASGFNAFSLGNNNVSSGQGAFTIGSFANATANSSMLIGASKATTPMTNSNPFSLWMGFESDTPTLYVGPGQGSGTFGNVGIGTSSPQAPLHVFAHQSDAAIFIPDGAAGTNPMVRISDPFGYPGMSMIRNGNRGDIRYSGEAVEFAAGTGTAGQGVMLRLTNWNALELFNGNYTDVDLAGGGLTGASINNIGELIRTPSDIRLKESVVELNDNLAKINLLRPVSYNFIDKEKYGNGRTLGFIAQEVEQIIPEVVKKSADDFQLRSLNYVEIIPVLTGAIQEQTKIIEDQKTLISDLVKRVETLEATCGKNRGGQTLPENTGGAYLKQNVPNPSSASTVIKFYLPSTVVSANMNFYDMSGKEIKSITINTRGEEASVTINAGELTAGMYMYSLIADGKEIDTKKMIITQ